VIDPVYHCVRTHYIGIDQHVHELFLSGGNWQSADLTSAAGGSTVSLSSSLVSLIDRNSSNAVREYYVGTDQHVHELFLSGGSWSDGDLFAIAPGPNAAMGSALASVFDPVYHGVRTYYIGIDQHVHELFLSGGNWQSANLTSYLGAPLAAPITSFQQSNTVAQYSGSWQQTAISGQYGSSQAQSNTAGNTVSFSFSGTQIGFAHPNGPSLGYAEITINGVVTAQVDEYSDTASDGTVEIYTGLSNGSHTIMIKVLGQADPDSSGGSAVAVDGFFPGTDLPSFFSAGGTGGGSCSGG